MICDFHREQAWERWTKRSENNLGEKRDELLALMLEVAKVENTDFEAALNNLKKARIGNKTQKFQKYFQNVWLAEKEMNRIVKNYLLACW